MFNSDLLKSKLSQISAKTLSLGGKDYLIGRNERKIKYSEAFEYSSLSGPRCYRLLRIQPSADTEVLSVELFESSLDDQVEFEALSYSWNLDPKISITKGDLVEDQKREERPILCNGKTLHITMNLYNALMEFRTLKLLTPLWADQVCINQQDGQEKIAQLAIMTQIYTSAATVIIWLGTLSRSKNWALDFMQSLPDQPVTIDAEAEAATVAVAELQLAPAIQRTDTLMNRINSPFAAISAISGSTMQNARWLATLMVLAGQWFQRIWTLQEFMLAKRFRFMMGNREIPPSAFMKASTQLAAFFAADTLAIHFGFNMAFSDLALREDLFDERDQYQNGKRYTAEEYFYEAKTRNATVPKDFVFAGAALIDQGIPTSVDYASTTTDIYCAFASERLWPEMGVRALNIVGGVQPTVEGLPSWVPDLSTSIHPSTMRSCSAQMFVSPLAPSLDDHRIDGKTLHLKAAKWDVVAKIGESMWSWADWSTSEDFAYNCSAHLKMTTSTTAAQERFGLMFALLDDIGQSYGPTGERSMTAFWKTLLGGSTLMEGEEDSTWQHRFFYYFAFLYLMMRADLTEAR
ncbi:putative heterokaryon incompatibility [Septoria linicola]|nr:putative heterokaryon incompatibility [Septoria linicola]